MKHLSYPKYHENIYYKELDNGLKVYLIPKNDYNKTFVTFTTNYGAFDQSFVPIGKTRRVNQPAGIAHFLEHKLFAMPDGSDAFEKLSAFGVSANAFTSFDKTSYLFSGTNHIKEALAYLLDFVQTPYFTKSSVEKEQGIIAEEYQMYQDYPDQRIYYGLLENMYQKHPINTEILGTIESIYEITAHKLYQAYETFYHPSNMVLTVIGNFDKDEILALITENQKAKGYQKALPIKRFLVKEPLAIAKKETTIEMSINMPYVGIGVKLIPETDLKALYKQELILDLLLGMYFHKSGEIYNSLLKKGIINQSFRMGAIQYEGALSIISYGMTPAVDLFISHIKRGLTGLKRRAFDEAKFNRQKKVMQGSFIRSLNNLESYNIQFMSHLPYGISLFDVPAIIDSITLDDLIEMAYQIKPSKMTTLIINPKKGNN